MLVLGFILGVFTTLAAVVGYYIYKMDRLLNGGGRT